MTSWPLIYVLISNRNLVTNALKYTEKGVVLVKLALLDLENGSVAEKDNGKLFQLIVRDTGKGISSQYLSTRLFTPFAQENSLAPGTGYVHAALSADLHL